MTSDEFLAWLRFHCARFRSVANVLNELTTQEESDVIEAWRELIGEFDLEHAKEATRAMFRAGDRRFFDQHPARVRELCMDIIEQRSRPKWHHEPIPAEDRPSPELWDKFRRMLRRIPKS